MVDRTSALMTTSVGRAHH